jgi:hypothetical protein
MTIKTLGTAISKKGEEVTFYYSTTIGSTKVLPLFLRSLADLIDKGLSLNSLPQSNNSKCVYAEINNQIVGFIVFTFLDDYTKSTWINLGTILENNRNQGLYTLLHRHLEQVAKSEGSKQILSFIHMKNADMLQACQSIGKHPDYYRVSMIL